MVKRGEDIVMGTFDSENTAKHAVLINNAYVESFSARHLSAYLKLKGFKISTIHYESRKEAIFKRLSDKSLKTIGDYCKGCDLVGISVLTTHSVPRSIQITQYLKKHTNVPVIWGGPPVIADPEHFLEHADLICAGEGEHVMEDLLRGVPKDSIKGLGYVTETGKKVINPLPAMLDLNTLPIPRLDLEDGYLLNGSALKPLKNHIPANLTTYSVILVRGCPYQCSYCLNSRLKEVFRGKGKYVRTIEVDRVIQELKWAKRAIPTLKRVVIDDDDFFLNSENRMREFLTRYMEEIDLPVFYLQGSTTQITQKKLEILKKSGLKLGYLKIGLQSASEHISREIFTRPLDQKDYLEKLEMIIFNKTRIMIDVISDNPYETIKEKHEVLRFYLEIIDIALRNETIDLPVRMYDHKLMFFPGTRLYEMAVRDRHLQDNYVDGTLYQRSTLRQRWEDRDNEFLIVELSNIAVRKTRFHRTAHFLLKLMALKPILQVMVRFNFARWLALLTRFPAVTEFLNKIAVQKVQITNPIPTDPNECLPKEDKSTPLRTTINEKAAA